MRRRDYIVKSIGIDPESEEYALKIIPDIQAGIERARAELLTAPKEKQKELRNLLHHKEGKLLYYQQKHRLTTCVRERNPETRTYRRFTPEERQYILDNYGTKSAEEIANAIGRHRQGIYEFMYKLGLKKGNLKD